MYDETFVENFQRTQLELISEFSVIFWLAVHTLSIQPIGMFFLLFYKVGSFTHYIHASKQSAKSLLSAIKCVWKKNPCDQPVDIFVGQIAILIHLNCKFTHNVLFIGRQINWPSIVTNAEHHKNDFTHLVSIWCLEFNQIIRKCYP